MHRDFELLINEIIFSTCAPNMGVTWFVSKKAYKLWSGQTHLQIVCLIVFIPVQTNLLSR